MSSGYCPQCGYAWTEGFEVLKRWKRREEKLTKQGSIKMDSAYSMNSQCMCNQLCLVCVCVRVRTHNIAVPGWSWRPPTCLQPAQLSQPHIRTPLNPLHCNQCIAAINAHTWHLLVAPETHLLDIGLQRLHSTVCCVQAINRVSPNWRPLDPA